MPSIAVDVMSGDSGAPECIPGALLALATDPALELILVGQPSVIEPALAKVSTEVRARLSVHPAATVVGMSEHPREAIDGVSGVVLQFPQVGLRDRLRT